MTYLERVFELPRLDLVSSDKLSAVQPTRPMAISCMMMDK